MEAGATIDRIWESYYMPKRFVASRFDNYSPATTQQQQALEWCKAYAGNGVQNIRQGKGLFLQGPVGSGKTHLAIATAYHCIEAAPEEFERRPGVWDNQDNIFGNRIRLSFISVEDLIKTLLEKSTGNITDTGLDMLLRTRFEPLVILDDIGVREKPTDFVMRELYGLIDYRYRSMRATIYTTNCSVQTLQKQLGERIVSRIIESADGIAVVGPNHRMRAMGGGTASA